MNGFILLIECKKVKRCTKKQKQTKTNDYKTVTIKEKLIYIHLAIQSLLFSQCKVPTEQSHATFPPPLHRMQNGHRYY